MSLTTIVTVHCDQCGHWVYTADHPAAVRARRGWRTERDEDGHRRDTCPACAPSDAADESTPGESS